MFHALSCDLPRWFPVKFREALQEPRRVSFRFSDVKICWFLVRVCVLILHEFKDNFVDISILNFFCAFAACWLGWSVCAIKAVKAPLFLDIEYYLERGSAWFWDWMHPKKPLKIETIVTCHDLWELVPFFEVRTCYCTCCSFYPTCIELSVFYCPCFFPLSQKIKLNADQQDSN